ncbi:MAG: YybS family protein [Spirochaetaceae bacterium]|nr:YybS family protein [Spirochaetaceae bacterium]
MEYQDEVSPPPSPSSLLIFSALGAGASILCVRTGFLSFFFLLPLALGAFFGGQRAAWAGGILAAAGNTIISLWLYMYRGSDPIPLLWFTLYYAMMALVFTWINAPLSRFWVLLETPYRMAAGALLCTLIVGAALLFLLDDSQLQGFVELQLTALNGLAGQEGAPTAAELTTLIVHTGLRGGILLSCIFFWWINRQIALGIFRIVRRLPPGGSLLSFRVPPFFIWIFSLALGAVVFGRIGNAEILEIGGWNILAFSGILFFVQGGAIVFYYLLKTPLFFRVLVNLGIIILLFIPGAITALLGLLLLLGIAENWVSFRVPK